MMQTKEEKIVGSMRDMTVERQKLNDSNIRKLEKIYDQMIDVKPAREKNVNAFNLVRQALGEILDDFEDGKDIPRYTPNSYGH